MDCVDCLILCKSQGLEYCLWDQLNNRPGNSPLALCFASGSLEGCASNFSPWSPSIPTLQLILTSVFQPSTLCSCPYVPPYNLSPSTQQPGTICEAARPDCCWGPTVLRCSLPSGHLAPHHSGGDLGGWQLPLAKGKQTEGQSGWWDTEE